MLGYDTAMIDVISPIIDDVIKVGEIAYEKYRSDVKITIKDDQTPVTNVDQLIHDELIQSLDTYFPDVPVISEEGDIPSFTDRQSMAAYWALDPLDGTVDFIKETDQFVISLGYIIITGSQPWGSFIIRYQGQLGLLLPNVGCLFSNMADKSFH